MSLRDMLLNVKSVDNDSDEFNATISMENIESELMTMGELDYDMQCERDLVDHLYGVAEGLENLIEVVEDTYADGGLDRTGAALLSVSSEHMVGNLGFDNPVLSLESFGGVGESLASTRVSVESLGDVLKKIWEAIKRAIDAVTKKMGQWYKAVFDGATKVKNRAMAVKKQAEKLKDKKMEEDSFDVDVSRLKAGKENKADPGGIITGLKAVGKMADGALVRQGNKLKSASDGVLGKLDAVASGAGKKKEFTKAAKALTTEAVNAMDEMRKMVDGVTKKESDQYKSTGSSDLTTYGTDALMGNFALVFRGPSDGDKTAIDNASVNVKKGKKKKKKDERDEQTEERDEQTEDTGEGGGESYTESLEAEGGSGTSLASIMKKCADSKWDMMKLEKDTDKDKVSVKTATVSQISDIADTVIDIADSMLKYEPKSKELTKQKNNIKKKGDKFNKDMEKKAEGEVDAEFIKRTYAMFSTLANIMDEPGKQVLDYSVKTCTAALNYCTGSMAQYK